MTRKEIATLIVGHGLRTAGVTLDEAWNETMSLPFDDQLSDIVPLYRRTGRHRFIYGLGEAGRGLNLQESLGVDDSLTVRNIVNQLAFRLPVRLYRCQDTVETHFYEQRGSGECDIDGTPLVEVNL